jgi:hypothetical protein
MPIGRSAFPGAGRAKQTQFPLGRTWLALGPSVRNKANSGGGKTETKPFAGKELCRVCLSHGFSKTKPIRATMPIRRSAFPGANRAKQSQLGRADDDRVPPSPAPRGCCTNKANFAGAPRNGRWLLSFRCQSCKTKPICPGEVSGEDAHPTKSRGRSCKTKPIPLRGWGEFAVAEGVRRPTMREASGWESGSSGRATEKESYRI